MFRSDTVLYARHCAIKQKVVKMLLEFRASTLLKTKAKASHCALSYHITRPPPRPHSHPHHLHPPLPLTLFSHFRFISRGGIAWTRGCGRGLDGQLRRRRLPESGLVLRLTGASAGGAAQYGVVRRSTTRRCCGVPKD